MNLNYTAPINRLGYGIVGLNLAVAFSSLGLRVALWPIGKADAEPKHHPMLKGMISNQADYDPHAPSLRLWHQFDMAQRVGRGLHCGYPIFELDTFTPREIHHLGQLDRIFVTSDWARGIVLNQVPSPGVRSPQADACDRQGVLGDRVRVAPQGVDRSIFNETVGNASPEWTTFLNIGKWEIRKGHDVLIKAFETAFDAGDRVRLYMMNDNPFLSPAQTAAWHKLYKESRMGDMVVLLPRVRTQGEVAGIMSKADCGVFPARAEGWNLGLLEMMSMGKPVIATNYAAHTEFCNAENCRLIEIDSLEPAYDEIWFRGQGRWASLGQRQVEQLADYMREVHELKQKGLPINQAGIETARRFSWLGTAKAIIAGFSRPS